MGYRKYPILAPQYKKERMRDVVKRRGCGETLASIADIYGLSRGRIRQIEAEFWRNEREKNRSLNIIPGGRKGLWDKEWKRKRTNGNRR